MGVMPVVVGAAGRPDAKVTVVILTYNQAAFVEESVRSVLGQVTDVDFDVIVRDDCSTDATPALLRGLQAEHPQRLRLILEESNQMSRGAFGLDNILPELRAPYVAFCEGDDVWSDKRKLDRQVTFMEANPWCAISHHDVSVRNEGGDAGYEELLRQVLDQPWRVQPRVAGVRLAEGNFLMTVSVMLRREAMRDDALVAARDVHPLDFVIFAVAAEGGDIGYVPDATATYRLHGGNFWSHLDTSERERRQREAHWFLCAHLRGEVRDAFRAVALARFMPDDDRRRMWADLADLRAELWDTAQQLAEAESQLRAIRSSTSWRMTAPVRATKDHLVGRGLLAPHGPDA
jgi:glycosyltransferase involved in cell wall biosynthesis